MPLDYTGKRQRVTDLQADIRSWMLTRDAAIFEHTHPGEALEEINRLEQLIAQSQKRIELIRHRLEHWEEIVDDANARIERLQRELQQTIHQEKINKLLELKAQLDAMELK